MERYNNPQRASNPTSIQKVYRISKLIAKVGYLKKVKKVGDAELGKMTSDELQTLGPTFIKIGQFMSSRSDVFGKDFSEQLKVLQDRIPPVHISEFASVLPTDAIDSIEPEPIASASIGQVHIATLKDGQKIVVKLKRPDIENTIRRDFAILMGILHAIQTVYKDRQTREFEILLREYSTMLLEEINFDQEVANMKVFKELFQNTKWLKVPTVYEDKSNNDVIVMEYVPSIKINDVDELTRRNFDTNKISEKLVECYLSQIVEYGYVHIDPHPGNVGMTPEGKIVFYDYGMILYLEPKLKTNFRKLLLALYDRDIDRVCELLLDLDIVILEPGKLPIFKKFVASFLAYIDNLDINEFKASYIDRVDQSDMPFLLSSKFLMLLRGLSLLEGVCRTLNPEFNYRMILDPYINDVSFDIEYIERRGNRDLMRFRNAPDKIALNEISVGIIEKDVEKLKKDLERSTIIRNLLLFAVGILAWNEPTLALQVKVGLLALTFLAIHK